MADESFLPYGQQHITDDDIQAVVEALRSDWLTQGPAVPAFEHALADYADAEECVAVGNGTAALHLAMLALGLGPGDVVITTPNTFVATANCVRMVGAEVRFADIDPATGLIDPNSIARLLERDHDHAIKAIIPVHFAGQPADLPAIYQLADRHGAWVVDDACHALGAAYQHDGAWYRVGGNPHSDLTVLSFHPVKHITTGEGGAILTHHPDLAERLRLFRNHGISRQGFVCPELAVSADGVTNPWYYEMQELGHNYRLTDLQAALGRSQLTRLPQIIERRREIAAAYAGLLQRQFPDGDIRPLATGRQVSHAYHLYVVRIPFERLGISRAAVMNRLRARGVGTQVHYIPVHLHPYYRRLCGTKPGDFPGAEAYYAETLTLPLFPELTGVDIERVMAELASVLSARKQPAAVAR